MVTKKKKLKTVILKPQKVTPFNLSFEDSNENTRIVMALQSLKSSAGWLFVTQILKENKEILSTLIINKIDTDGKPITEAQADEARYKYGYINELIETPDKFLKKLQPHADIGEDYDPYDKGKS